MSSVAELQSQSAKTEASLPKRASVSPALQPEHPLLHLQRSIGNQAVMRMLRPQGAPDTATSSAPFLQRKLTMNEPGDAYEQEADRVSDHVMRMPTPTATPTPGRTPHIQMKTAGSNSAGGAEAPPIVHEVLRSPGQPLDAGTRAFMEPRFGQDFSNVRVHTDSKAADSARAVNAKAYTVGKDVVFGAGEFAPGSSDGQKLLGHELAHVLQQLAGDGVPRIAQRTEDWNFTPDDFSELKKNKGSLKFDSDSSWFPSAFQTNLLDTLNFVLDPTRKKPATKGVSTEDFFHGHIAMKGQKSTELNKRTGEYNKVGEEEYSNALGGSRINPLTTKNLAAYKTAVEKTEPSAKAMLEEAAKLKDVVVIYHTFENNRPADMRAGSPERNFLTPLGGSPKPYSPPDPDSAGTWANEFTDIFQFNFLVDEKGVIHVRPGFASSSQELSTVTGKPEK